jgi:intracellular multiplication protein IcmP
MINFVGGYLHFNTDTLSSLRLAMESARDNPSNVQFTDVMTAGNMVGRILRIPLVIILVICAMLVFVSSTTRVFKRTYNMRDLAKEEKTNWPQITPVIDLDLIKTDIDTGPWAMAMTPVQFCKKFRLLDEVKPQRQEGMHRKDWDRIDVVLKRGEANKLFALQLGPLWRGTNNLPPHARALFAVFAARINADTAPAAKLLAQLSVSCMAKQLNMEGVDELLKKHENTKLVQQKVQSHAYVTTVMATMLAGAREDGVQASSDFLWLKPLDRRLWYTLNTVGRQTPFVEVAGVFAHWVAEKEAGRKLIVPMVEEATNAVELALKEVVYKRDEK